MLATLLARVLAVVTSAWLLVSPPPWLSARLSFGVVLILGLVLLADALELLPSGRVGDSL